MNQPLVSVVMPTYNRAKLLPRAIESVLSQSYKNFEFIIVNDASPDNTEEVIKPYLKKDPRIVYLKNEKNLYIAGALNRGIATSKASYIARIDDDDIWIDPHKLEKQINFLELHPDYVIVGTGNVAIFKGKGIQIKSLKPETDQEIREAMLIGCPFLHPSVVFRREAFLKAGQYDEEIIQAEDYSLWMRLGKIGKMYNLQEYCIESLVGETNVGHQKRHEFLMADLTLLKRHRRDYPNFYRAYIWVRLKHFDATHPGLRKALLPIYWIRRKLIDSVSEKKIAKL